MSLGTVASRVARATRRFRFVLAGPRSGGNVGSCARVLANLGFRRLDIVDPACDPTGDEAVRMAVAAEGLLRSASVHVRLDDALDGCGLVVGTTRRAGKHRRPHFRIDDVASRLAEAAASGEDVAIVFGREDHGLSDDELDRCTHLAYLPASESYPSFNLAQAVALCAWEAARAVERDPAADANEDGDDDGALAGHAEREAMYRHLETALLTVGFLHRDSLEPMMRRIRRLVGRAGPTSTEVKMLRGIARQVLWAARRAGLSEVDRDGLGDGDRT